MMPVEMAYKNVAASMEDRNQLVMQELQQVYYIANRIRERLPQHVALEDLVNAGVVGLLEACRNYDSSKPAQFKTYAKHRIRGAILDSLRDLDWAPRMLRRKGREVEDAVARLEVKLGRAPSEPELAKELTMSLPELHSLLGELDSLDIVGQSVAASFDRSETHDIVESAPSRGGDNPFELYAEAEKKKLLAAAIAKLSEREQLLLSLYYHEELTMKEVAATMGIAESRVSQMHSLAMTRLRASMQRPARAARAGR